MKFDNPTVPHLTTLDVAEMVGRSEQWVRDMDSRAGVEPLRVGIDKRGGIRLYTLRDVEKLLRFKESSGRSAA